MSESLSTSQLKKRLLGAAMLIILAALLLPLFLGEPKPVIQEPVANSSNEFESKIQPLPEEQTLPEIIVPEQSGANSGLVLESMDEPVSDDAKANDSKVKVLASNEKPEATESSIESTSKPAVKTKQAVAASAPVAKSKAEPVKKPVVENKTSRTSIKNGWVVQAGIFSEQANAKAVADILKKKGMQPTISSAKASFGEATRVWIGPYKSKTEAKAASSTLKQKTGDGGYVAQYPFKS